MAIKFSSVPHKMFVAGRGTGKTTIHADDFLEDVIYMPRGKFGFGGLTYFHVRTKSMPAIIDQWERRGIFRNIHYFTVINLIAGEVLSSRAHFLFRFTL